jgi:hypothetical protein
MKKIDRKIIHDNKARWVLYRLLEDFKNIKELKEDTAILRFFLNDESSAGYVKSLFSERDFNRLARYINAFAVANSYVVRVNSNKRGHGLDEYNRVWDFQYGDSLDEFREIAKSKNKRIVEKW